MTTIVVTGGGSGGHITPVLAVASALKSRRPDCRIVYIGQRGEPLLYLAIEHPAIDRVETVLAGKFRRYHGAGWRQFLHIRTQLLNTRDLIRFLIGTVQSYRLLGKLRPAVIFTRGGFVSVPVALAAGQRKIPYVTHDSDSIPSLANRLIARRAIKHLVALPIDSYPYPAAKTVMTGIPLADSCQPVTEQLQDSYRQQIGINKTDKLVLVTGGGNGARLLNQAVVAAADDILREPNTRLVVLAGLALQAETQAALAARLSSPQLARVEVLGFSDNFYAYSGAADVIIARGGATNLAEFAVQGKACIIVPADYLVGGHQTKNAQALARNGAIRVLSQAEVDIPGRLSREIRMILQDQTERQRLQENISRLGQPHAAQLIADELLAIIAT